MNDASPLTLTMNDLTTSHDDHTILQGLSLQIAPGRITAIMGPDACGKSTLLRCIARLLLPHGGQVLLSRHDIQRMPPC